MIEILTLLYGLLLGPSEVELEVSPATAQVEFRFEDEVLARHVGPPWKITVPFPETPRPGRLQVRALDHNGELLAAADQLINIDFDSCEQAHQGQTPFVLNVPASAGSLTPADLAGWFEVAGRPLEVMSVTSPAARVMVVQEPEAQEAFDRLTIHFLRTLGGGESVSTERAVELANQELLAIADHFLVPPPTDPSLADPVSVEPAPADDSSREVPLRPTQSKLEQALRTWQQALSFETEGTMQFIWPHGPPVAQLDHRSHIHPMIGPFDAEEKGWMWNLRSALMQQKRLRVADAVAVAGLEAAASCGRRAVVLLQSVFSGEDSSLLEPSTVRGYLEALQVSLVVLRDLQRRPRQSQTRQEIDRWGPAFFIQAGSKPLKKPRLDGLVELHHRLDSLLRQQRVVWLKGKLAPSEIDFRPGLPGYKAAGQESEAGSHD